MGRVSGSFLPSRPTKKPPTVAAPKIVIGFPDSRTAKRAGLRPGGKLASINGAPGDKLDFSEIAQPIEK